MMNNIIKEIHNALDNECYLSALNLCIVLPDICGSIHYPNDKNGERYRKWYKNFVLDKLPDISVVGLNERQAWAFRNKIIHSGIYDTDSFGVYVSDIKLCAKDECSGHRITCKLKNESIQDISVELNVILFCKQICACVETDYKNNKSMYDKVNFNSTVSCVFYMPDKDDDSIVKVIRYTKP